ncbi:MAG: outer membrane protein [Oleispira sp.]|jgi:outer membrane protein
MCYCKKHLTSKHLIAASLLLACAENVSASDSSSHLALGAGYGHKSSIYLDGKDEITFYPAINTHWKLMYFKKYKVGVYFAGNNDWALSLSYGLDNREDKKRGNSDLLKGIPDLNNVFVASIDAEFHHEFGNFNIIYSIDASDEHNGKIIDLGYSYPWKSNKHAVSLELKASLISKEVAQYYYGFQTEKKTKGHHNYQPSDEINWSYGVNYNYAITPSTFLFTLINFSKLSNKIKRSPLVEKTESNSILFGLTYLF